MILPPLVGLPLFLGPHVAVLLPLSRYVAVLCRGMSRYFFCFFWVGSQKNCLLLGAWKIIIFFWPKIRFCQNKRTNRPKRTFSAYFCQIEIPVFLFNFYRRFFNNYKVLIPHNVGKTSIIPPCQTTCLLIGSDYFEKMGVIGKFSLHNILGWG